MSGLTLISPPASGFSIIRQKHEPIYNGGGDTAAMSDHNEVELYPGRSTADRPDFIIRAFHMKDRMLYEGLCKDGIFGHAVAREYQTRSLLHMHLHLFPEDHRFLF